VTGVVAELLQRDRGKPSPDVGGQTGGVLTAPKPDVRVVVFPAETVSRTPGVDHLLGIRIQNYSPVVVYMSGISILLKSGRGLLLYRDVVTGREQSRVAVRPGESYMWSTGGDDLLRDVEIDDVIGVVAYDDIGREFREPEGTLRNILQDWSAKDEGGRGSKPSIEAK
jgi:hypothetical protein